MAHDRTAQLNRSIRDVEPDLREAAGKLPGDSWGGARHRQEALQLYNGLAGALTLATGAELHEYLETASELRDIGKQTAQKFEELQDLEEAMRELARRFESGAHEKAFDDAAKRFHIEAIVWSLAALVLGALAAKMGLLLWESAPASGEALGELPGRLTVIAVTLWAVSFCARNFRVARHNETTNRHRVYTLLALDLYLQREKDPEARSVMIRQAAEATFGPQITGFTGNESGDSFPSIVEVLSRKQS